MTDLKEYPRNHKPFQITESGTPGNISEKPIFFANSSQLYQLWAAYALQEVHYSRREHNHVISQAIQLKLLTVGLAGNQLSDFELQELVNGILDYRIPTYSAFDILMTLSKTLQAFKKNQLATVNKSWKELILLMDDPVTIALELTRYFDATRDKTAIAILRKQVRAITKSCDLYTAKSGEPLLSFLSQPSIVEDEEEDDHFSNTPATDDSTVLAGHSKHVHLETHPHDPDEDIDPEFLQQSPTTRFSELCRLARATAGQDQQVKETVRPIHNLIMEATQDLLLQPAEYADILEDLLQYIGATDYLKSKEKMGLLAVITDACAEDMDDLGFIILLGSAEIRAKLSHLNTAMKLLNNEDPELALAMFEDGTLINTLLIKAIENNRFDLVWNTIGEMLDLVKKTEFESADGLTIEVNSDQIEYYLHIELFQVIFQLTYKNVEIDPKMFGTKIEAMISAGYADGSLELLADVITFTNKNLWLKPLLEHRVKTTLRSMPEYNYQIDTPSISYSFLLLTQLYLKILNEREHPPASSPKRPAWHSQPFP